VELPDPIVAFEDSFDGLYGLEVLEEGPDLVRGQIPVRDAVKQGMGLVHGGVYASAAESLTSWGTFLGVKDEGKITMGMSNHTTFLRPITEGTIHVEARPRHRGRTTWVWEVDVTDDAGRLCALVRMTVAVREIPGG
jgi:uncharacterized protein (TIGR00369 family)